MRTGIVIVLRFLAERQLPVAVIQLIILFTERKMRIAVRNSNIQRSEHSRIEAALTLPRSGHRIIFQFNAGNPAVDG